MTILDIQQNLKGKWKYNDGRIIEFFNNDEYELTPRGGGMASKGKIFFQQKEGFIQMSLPKLMEPICVIKDMNENTFTYLDYDMDGSSEERKLERL